MISDPCGLERLVAPIVIVPAAATAGAVAMDATSGGKSRISEPNSTSGGKSHVLGPKTPSNVSTTAAHFKMHVLPPQDDAAEGTASNST